AHPRPDVLLRYRGVGQLLGEGQGPSASAAAVNWREAMRPIVPCLFTYTMLYVRLALGITLLTAVTDRFGLWGPPGTSNVAWGNFDNFLAYAATLNPYLPTAWIPTVGWGGTLAGVVWCLAPLVGFQTRRVAVVSGLMLLAYALGMIMGFGIKAPLSYSVFSASAGALLPI